MNVERSLICLFLAAAIAFSVAPVVNQLRKMRQHQDGTKDYPLWYDTGNRELHNVSPYHIDRNGEFPFMYPPGSAGLLAPLSIAGRLPMMLFLVLLNSAAWATCILAPIYLLTGKVRGQPAVLYWVPSLVCCVFIWDTYLEGQMAFCLCAALLGMLVCLQTKRQWSAGFLLALAAGWKAFPILALPYLVYRRQWKALASTCVFLVVLLFVIPSFFRGPTGAWDDLKTWRSGMMEPNTPEQIGGPHARAARSYTWQNGSLLAVAHRWLRPVIADHDDHVPPMSINVANLNFKTINRLVMVLQLCICLAYVAVMPWKRGRSRFTDTAEGAMLLILIVLFCPLSFNYNNSWLMCGITVVLYYVTVGAKSRTQAIVALVWLLLALSLLVFSVSTRDPNWRHIRAMGNTFFTDVLLLAELGWLLLNCRGQSKTDDGVAVPRFPGKHQEYE
jgi:energy-coupling factor transporter transmembrane protein EcfT